MPRQRKGPFRGNVGRTIIVALTILLQACATTAIDPASQASLINSKESAPSNLGPVEVVQKFIGIDGEPTGTFSFGEARKQVAPGARNLGVRIFRKPATWNNGHGMYSTFVIGATLKAGHTYRIVGRYDDSYLGRYAIADAGTGELVSAYVDAEFTLVESKATLIIPIPITR